MEKIFKPTLKSFCIAYIRGLSDNILHVPVEEGNEDLFWVSVLENQKIKCEVSCIEEKIIFYGFKEWAKYCKNINLSIYLAAFKGYLDLVKFFIERIERVDSVVDSKENSVVEYYEKNAFGYRSIDPVRFIKERYLLNKEPNGMKKGIYGAIEGGHKEIFEYFREEQGIRDHRNITFIAILKGNLEMVKLFDEKHIFTWGWDYLLSDAVYYGHKQIIEYFIKRGANNWDMAMSIAAKRGYKDLVLFFIENGATDMNMGIRYAILGNQRNLVEFFLERGANKLNEYMALALMGRQWELTTLFIIHGADDWERGFYYAKISHQPALIKFFKKHLRGSRKYYSPVAQKKLKLNLPN